MHGQKTVNIYIYIYIVFHFLVHNKIVKISLMFGFLMMVSSVCITTVDKYPTLLKFLFLNVKYHNCGHAEFMSNAIW
jgi:hypothetical protein